MSPAELNVNRLVVLALDRVRPVMAAEHAFKTAHRDAAFTLDELQFYFMRVGASLARLLAHCEQLEHALAYLATYRATPQASATGASKQTYLRFISESYLVRTQTTTDLALKLIDAVFHLTNDPRQCRYQTIVENIRVKDSDCVRVVNKLDSKVRELAKSRNIVVHHGGYSDRPMYEMELPAELLRACRASGEPLPEDLSYLPQYVSVATKAFVIGKTKEFTRFNGEVIALVGELLDSLVAPFQENERRLQASVTAGA